MEEKVLVVPRSKLFANGEIHGFSRNNKQAILPIIEKESFFMDRRKAEEDSSFKQLIPYVVLTFEKNIFTVTRLKEQGEARLHDKVSIGLGGHINPEDLEGLADGEKPWEAGLKRELKEELFIEEAWKARLAGFINDDAVPVGKVHFGLVYQVDLPGGKVTIQEKGKMTGKFLPPGEVSQSYENLETWSQFVFSALWPETLRV